MNPLPATSPEPAAPAWQRLSALLQAVPVGVVETDFDGRIVSANPAAERLLRLPQAQLLGLTADSAPWRTVDEHGAPLSASDLATLQALATGRSTPAAMLGLDFPDGGRRWVRVSAEPLKAQDGRVTGAVSCLLDITDACEQRRLLELTLSAAGLGTWEWQIEAGRLRFDDRWHPVRHGDPGDAAAGDMPAGGALGWRDLLHPADLTQAMQRLEDHFEHREQPFQCEMRTRAPGGRWAWTMVTGAVIDQDADGRPRRMAGVHFDITRRKQLEQALAQASLTDVLTQLPNRQALIDHLQQCRIRAAAAEGGRRDFYAVLFLDFDRFKRVNDSLGHDAGDELLRQIAARIQGTLRSDDTLSRCEPTSTTAARLGGDEFVVLLDRLNEPADAERVAQRLLDTLRLPYRVAGQEVRSTASVGIVTSDRDDLDPFALLRDADTAMYEAKRRGRGRCVVFTDALRARMLDALALADELKQALAPVGDIRMLYGPVVELASNRTVGVEALPAWHSVQRGVLAADALQAAADECGLGAELGRVLLSIACREFAAWREARGDAPATVSVPLGRSQVQGVDLKQQVLAVLREAGLPATALRVEVTAAIACSDPAVIDALRGLRALGVGVVLSEIGNGGPRLASLDQLPLDAVKLTPTFAARLGTSSFHAAAVEATLRVTQALGAELIASGVHGLAQAQQLRRLGCLLAQGPLFGAAQPAPVSPPPAPEGLENPHGR